MIDAFILFSPGGLVLFNKNFTSVVWNEFISTVLIQERQSDHIIGNRIYCFKKIPNLIAAVCYPLILKLDWVSEFLDKCLLEFSFMKSQFYCNQFEPIFDDLLHGFEQVKKQSKPRSFLESRKYQKTLVLEQEKTLRKPGKKIKEMRDWDDMGATKKSTKLDYSDSKEPIGINQNLIGNLKGTINSQGDYEALDLELPTNKSKSSTNSFLSYLSNLGTRILTKEQIEPAMLKMKEHLIQRNVAAETAGQLCESVLQSLIGKKSDKLTRMDSLLKEEMKNAISKTLTPNSSTDILREIKAAKLKNNPYSIAFVGVNGVGKSTNLSKVCFWLLQNKLSVLIAACDTFRAGAVEQLRVHVRNLKELQNGSRVELFDRGYGKDPAGIAKEAISYAKSQNHDVVLIDTAGRMQDNEPLMRALAKLISVNDPNKIIFVGEALVGNEAVDQVRKFNHAIQDFSGKTSPRKIDGMILTKFDTIDEKVGAALSLTFTTGKPIYFVGTGQTYTDLRKMNVSTIVDTLMRN